MAGRVSTPASITTWCLGGVFGEVVDELPFPVMLIHNLLTIKKKLL